MRQKVFIAGPYAPIPSLHLTTQDNILQAEDCAIWCWLNGFDALCPHLNTRDFHLMAPLREDIYADFYLSLLSTYPFHGLILLPNWQHSRGARREVSIADQLSIPKYLWTPLTRSTLKRIK